MGEREDRGRKKGGWKSEEKRREGKKEWGNRGEERKRVEWE